MKWIIDDTEYIYSVNIRQNKNFYCDENKSMVEILSITADENCKNIIFGFTPKDTSECSIKVFEEDDTTLFVLKDKENIFNEYKVMFPLLSHA